MGLPIHISSAAVRDVVGHAAYLGERSEESDARFLDAVERTFDRISEVPEIGSSYISGNARLADMRVWRVDGFDQYLVFYRIDAGMIHVIRVLRRAHDISAIFGD